MHLREKVDERQYLLGQINSYYKRWLLAETTKNMARELYYLLFAIVMMFFA